MLRNMITLLIAAIVLYAGALAYLFFNQTNLIFPANRISMIDLYDDVPIENLPLEVTPNITLQGGMIRDEAQDAPVILMFTGNAQHAVAAMQDYARDVKGAHWITFNYRGYGKSQGTPSQDAILADAQLAYNKVKELFPDNKLILVGISLGSAVATHIAANNPADELLVLSPYDAITQVAQDAYPIFPVTTLVKHRFNTTEDVKKLRLPVSIVRVSHDDLVLPKRTEAYKANLKTLKDEVIIHGPSHGMMLGHRLFYNQLNKMVERVQ